jgi:glycosyltransferase involved in cell wall biosynthesis
MRIVMVAPFATRPKMTVTARMLPMARALVKRGHQVTVVIPPWDYKENSGKKEKGDGVDIINIQLPRRYPLLGFMYHLIIIWRLLSHAIASRPEAIYTFKPIGYSGFVAIAIWMAKKLRLLKVRLVVDTDDWEGPGGWNERLKRSRWGKYVLEYQEKWCLRHCDALTVVSKTLQLLAWAHGVPDVKVHYVPNGVPDYLRAWPGQGAVGLSDNPMILVYTRFTECDVDRIVDIAKRISSTIQEAEFIIVGDGFDREVTKLKRTARQADIDDKIITTGWVPLEMLPKHFAIADIAIYPCDDVLINRAKCSIKILELMAAGKAIVADRVGQISEYIESQVSGILVSPEDPTALADEAIRLLVDPDLKRRLGEAARTRAFNEFNWAKLVEKVERACSGG